MRTNTNNDRSPPDSKPPTPRKPGQIKDPNHPIVALASERIVELTARKAAVTGALDVLKAKRPAGHDPDEVLAMLDAVPDLRPALATATEVKLAAIFQAFDVEITYHRDQQPSSSPPRSHPS